ncbi:MAG: 16S rRNA (cytosine(1402)-N(4))-methyltransferase RsmH [Planktomarina sp.]|nr:16S rRNA (cytosine(1402)-N(4))-methyltransferase RsmH [Planktomarina sp.]
MTVEVAPSTSNASHIPVLISQLISAAAPITGTWIDGTFGAGGYTKYLLNAGADKVIGIDRDPSVFDMASDWLSENSDRLQPVQDTFSNLDKTINRADGVVLDIGVSSMQIDQAERGFSFQKDGPLDMRMSGTGGTAADLINSASEEKIADILFHFGEERASRRIAKMIVARRDERPFERTLDLVSVIQKCLPRSKPGQTHPATRSFQALRIAVNSEYNQLVEGLFAAERVLDAGGVLAVVTFHSIEDRIVKRFFQSRSGSKAGSRYAPLVENVQAQFTLQSRKPIRASADEISLNPRSRSAKLRIGWRTSADPTPIDVKTLGVPELPNRINS